MSSAPTITCLFNRSTSVQTAKGSRAAPSQGLPEASPTGQSPTPIIRNLARSGRRWSPAKTSTTRSTWGVALAKKQARTFSVSSEPACGGDRPLVGPNSKFSLEHARSKLFPFCFGPTPSSELVLSIVTIDRRPRSGRALGIARRRSRGGAAIRPAKAMGPHRSLVLSFIKGRRSSSAFGRALGIARRRSRGGAAKTMACVSASGDRAGARGAEEVEAVHVGRARDLRARTKTSSGGAIFVSTVKRASRTSRRKFRRPSGGSRAGRATPWLFETASARSMSSTHSSSVGSGGADVGASSSFFLRPDMIFDGLRASRSSSLGRRRLALGTSTRAWHPAAGPASETRPAAVGRRGAARPPERSRASPSTPGHARPRADAALFRGGGGAPPDRCRLRFGRRRAPRGCDVVIRKTWRPAEVCAARRGRRGGAATAATRPPTRRRRQHGSVGKSAAQKAGTRESAAAGGGPVLVLSSRAAPRPYARRHASTAEFSRSGGRRECAPLSPVLSVACAQPRAAPVRPSRACHCVTNRLFLETGLETS